MPADYNNEDNISATESPSVVVIGGYRNRNTGFIRYLYLLAVDSIVDVINPNQLLTGQADNTVLAGGLILAASTSYNLMLFPPRACVFSEAHLHQVDGEEYTCSIEMLLPRTETSIRNWIHQQNNRRWIAIMQDTNGYWYQVGDIDTPLTWSIETSIASTNAMKYVLRTKMWHPAWSLSNPLLYGVVPTTDNYGPVIPILGSDCKAEIDEIKRRLDTLSEASLGITMLEKQLPTSTPFSESVYYEFAVGSNTYKILGLSSTDAVLLNRLKTGEIGVEEKSVRLSPVQNNQTEFVVPASLDGVKIAKFAVNHVPYSEGIEYMIIEVGEIRKIVWVNSEFEIAATDLVEIIYLKVQSSQF